MARAENGRPLWRAADGNGWVGSDGSRVPASEIAPRALRLTGLRGGDGFPDLGSSEAGSGMLPELEEELVKAEAVIEDTSLFDAVGAGADDFSERHRQLSYRAGTMARETRRRPSEMSARAFEASLDEVRRNRLVVDWSAPDAGSPSAWMVAPKLCVQPSVDATQTEESANWAQS